MINLKFDASTDSDCFMFLYLMRAPANEETLRRILFPHCCFLGACGETFAAKMKKKRDKILASPTNLRARKRKEH